MRYNWNLKELEANRIILEEVLKKFNDDDEMKANINESINLYKNMIQMATNHNKGISVFDDNYTSYSLDEMIDDLIYSYSKDNLKYLYLILNSFFIIKDSTFDTKDAYIKICATNDEIVDIAMDFFKEMTTPKITQKFQDILDEKDKIQINYETAKSDYGGLALVDDALQNKYIYIGRRNELLDLNLLPHEAFHYIFNDADMGIARNYNTQYLNELEGMFANILFADYYSKIAHTNNNIFKDYSNRIYQEHVEDLVIRNTLLSALTENKKIRFNKLNKFLKSICPNSDDFKDEDELAPYLETPQYLTITYSLSYLAAIDLYYRYLKDREEAFYNLGCIKYNKKTNQVLTLLQNNGITFMKDDYKNLKKYIKK